MPEEIIGAIGINPIKVEAISLNEQTRIRRGTTDVVYPDADVADKAGLVAQINDRIESAVKMCAAMVLEEQDGYTAEQIGHSVTTDQLKRWALYALDGGCYIERFKPLVFTHPDFVADKSAVSDEALVTIVYSLIWCFAKLL